METRETPSPIRYRSQAPVFTELVGPRVLLRPLRREDAAAFFAAVDESRLHLRPFILWDRFHQTVEDSLDFILDSEAQWLLREQLRVGIFERASGRLLGGTGLMFPGNGWDIGACEIGYWLRASATGHGYMAEAVRLLTAWAFTGWHAQRVEIDVDARNVRSAAVAHRLGFVLEGGLRNALSGEDGLPHDQLIFALTREDYERGALRALHSEATS